GAARPPPSCPHHRSSPEQHAQTFRNKQGRVEPVTHYCQGSAKAKGTAVSPSDEPAIEQGIHDLPGDRARGFASRTCMFKQHDESHLRIVGWSIAGKPRVISQAATDLCGARLTGDLHIRMAYGSISGALRM